MPHDPFSEAYFTSDGTHVGPLQVWIARESYCEEHAFIGVFLDAEQAKAACQAYHGEIVTDDDEVLLWRDYADVVGAPQGEYLNGYARNTAYKVHTATVGERWEMRR